MSHDDIRAALEAATRQPWMLLYPGQCCEGFCIESEDGRDAVTHGLEGSVSDLDLITSAPTWLAELLAEVDRLARWKAEALPVITGLQELGSALGIPLGKRITGPDTLAAVKALTARAEAAEQAIQRVRAMPATPPSGGYYMVSMREVLSALDGGAS